MYFLNASHGKLSRLVHECDRFIEHFAGRSLESNQYSVHEYFQKGGNGHDVSLPSVYFIYDLSPIAVLVVENRKNLAHFLVKICAVVGGVIAVTGMLDRYALISKPFSPLFMFVFTKLSSEYLCHLTCSADACNGAQVRFDDGLNA